VVTIQNLEVRFEVDGDDREAFARLFREYIRRYEEHAEARKTRDERSRRDRAVGDETAGAGQWT
jgi:hypothetical protein